MDFGVVGLDHHHHHHHNNNNHGLGVSSSSSSEAGFASNNVISSSSPSDPEANQHHQRASLCGSEFSYVKQERSSLEEYWRSSSKVAKTASDGVDVDFSSSVCKGMVFHQRNNNDASLLRSNSNTSNSNNNNNNNNATTLSFLDNGSYNNNSQSQQHHMLSFSSASPIKSEAHSNAATLAYFPNALSAYTATRNTAQGYNNNSSMMMHNGGGGLMMRSGPFTASQWTELEHQALIYKYITANVPIPTSLLIPIRKPFDFPPSLLRPSTNPLGPAGWGKAFQLGYSNNADPEPGRCRRTDGKKWRCSRDAVADQKYCERHMNRGRHRSRKPVEGPVATSNNANIISTNTNTNVAKPAQQSFASSTRTFAKENASAAAREFGLVTSVDALLLNQRPSLSSHPQNSLHQFMDSWPDRTQLSISIPNATSETSLSPLRLSNAAARQAQWIPTTWEGSSPGGPLGEVLINKPNSNNGVVSDHHKKSASSSSSVLNLMPEGAWDGSPPLGSSPTGVLQKTAFGSMSNSSAGSSPARAHDGLCVNIDLLPPPHLTSSSSLPAM